MSKRITYLFIWLAFPLLSLAGDKADALFATGNDQYAKAKYKDAVQSYQSILTNGWQSATVYFNLGNAYYKSGDIPSAILYYEKAHKLNPGDDDVNFNIQLANLKITDKIDAAPQFFLTNWWDSFILFCPVSTLSWLSILFFLAGCGALIVYLYAPSVNLKRTTFYGAVTLAFLGLITVLMAASQVHYFASHQQAIVFNNSVTVKSEPGAAAKTLFVIHEGTKVDVLETSSTWARVKLLNGNEGWIQISDVKDI